MIDNIIIALTVIGGLGLISFGIVLIYTVLNV